MRKKYIWWIVVAVIIAGAVFLFGRSGKKADTELITKVSQGEFEVLVAVTGELIAKNFENISGPDMRSGVFRINDIRIQDLVDEGTLVKTGDYVAELDRTSASLAVRDMEEQIDVSLNRVETAILDTAVSLKGLRDNLLNMALAVEEARITLEESKFEPPATIRKAEINLDKAGRALEQAEAQYHLREQQSKVNVMDAQLRLDRQQRQYEQMSEILSGFIIRAPKNGMVIYRRERNGQKRKTGSSISPWDPIVATLPDLSVMISKTYVNEIDISKVKKGQEVRIGVDAFPEKKYTGEVVTVADIGEQLANSDAKLFEVIIEINESDPIMRPSMTTSNTIIINTLKDVTFVPIDAIYSQDSIPFVYATNHTKKVVILGESNENEIIIEQGLSPDEKVYLSIPDNSETWKMVGEELIPIIKQRALEKKREQEELEKKAAEDSRNQRQRGRNSSQRGDQRGDDGGLRGGDGSPRGGDGGQRGGGGGQRGGGGR